MASYFNEIQDIKAIVLHLSKIDSNIYLFVCLYVYFLPEGQDGYITEYKFKILQLLSLRREHESITIRFECLT